MNILVTGGMGFIGHNVVSKLEKLSHRTIIADNRTNYNIIPKEEIEYLMIERAKKVSTPHNYTVDICSTNLEMLFSNYKPQVVIHFASFPRQKVVNTNPVYGSKVMSEGLLHLLELSKKHHIEKFIYISSSMVYGDFTDNVKEDYDCKPLGQYGILKLAGEWLVKDYGLKNFFDYTIIRPSAVYGPLDVEDRVISKFMLAAMRGQSLNVNGAKEKLDFTYVDDLSNGIVSATLSNNTKNKTYNITRSKGVSLLDAANIVVKIVGKGTVNVKDRDASFPTRGSLCIDAAKKDFDYTPTIDIEEGFKLYYDWLANSSFWSRQTI